MARVITYKELAERNLNGTDNKLLQLTKFCAIWEPDELRFNEETKKSFIASFKGEQNTLTSKVREAFVKKYEKMAVAINERTPAILFKLKTDSKMAVGFGGQSPTENSLALHHVYGFPIIPGSTLKGIARAYAEISGESSKTELKDLFGSEDKGDNENSIKGKVAFYDSIPSSSYRFTADIITPHYQSYYGDDTNEMAPGDYWSPIPVPFLCLDTNIEFAFLLSASDKVLLERATHFLKSGLVHLGVGAKTNVGLGFFKDIEATSSLLETGDTQVASSELLVENSKQRLLQGNSFLAIVTGFINGVLLVELPHKERSYCNVQLKYPAGLEVGSKVKMKITQLSKDKNNLKGSFEGIVR